MEGLGVRKGQSSDGCSQMMELHADQGPLMLASLGPSLLQASVSNIHLDVCPIGLLERSPVFCVQGSHNASRGRLHAYTTSWTSLGPLSFPSLRLVKISGTLTHESEHLGRGVVNRTSQYRENIMRKAVLTVRKPA